MRIILYFLAYSCLVISLFFTFLYLMTKVDPGLLELPEKAAQMVKTDVERGRGAKKVSQEMFMKFAQFWNKSSNIILIN